jgi:hypothetical protein
VFLGNSRHASWWRKTCPQTETTPLIVFIYCRNRRRWRRWWTVIKVTTSFLNSKNISNLVLGCFCNFVIKPPDKL